MRKKRPCGDEQLALHYWRCTMLLGDNVGVVHRKTTIYYGTDYERLHFLFPFDAGPCCCSSH